MTKSNDNEIMKLEHDDVYDVKKVSNFVSDGSGSLVRETIADFGIGGYDYIALTYVATGNGAGEIETVVYKDGGASGATVATLTLAYNADNEISNVTKT